MTKNNTPMTEIQIFHFPPPTLVIHFFSIGIFSFFIYIWDEITSMYVQLNSNFLANSSSLMMKLATLLFFSLKPCHNKLLKFPEKNCIILTYFIPVVSFVLSDFYFLFCLDNFYSTVLRLCLTKTEISNNSLKQTSNSFSHNCQKVGSSALV